MKILDLTRGKYIEIYPTAIDQFYDRCVNSMAEKYSYSINHLFAKGRNYTYSRLNRIPIFLVESSMSGKYVAVPECQCSVFVPTYDYNPLACYKNFDIEKWVASKKTKKDNPLERISHNTTLNDKLGCYIYAPDNETFHRQIFIWMDKVKDYAETKTKNKAEISDNARILLDFTLFYEMSHALMDVELYELHPSPYFSYDNDYPYRFIEEAFSTCIAYEILTEKQKGKSKISTQQQKFVEDFVKNEGCGFVDDLLENFNVEEWFAIKVLFSYDVAVLLREERWDENSFDLRHYETPIVGDVFRKGWIRVKDHFNKFGIMELPSQKMVAGFKKYDYISFFEETGVGNVRLCKVELNGLYGFVNEQGVEQIPIEYEEICDDEIFNSFHNGIVIAKKNSKYGTIDIYNNIIIPFNLPYEYIHPLHNKNGKAFVTNSARQWGIIDIATGKEVDPCNHPIGHSEY